MPRPVNCTCSERQLEQVGCDCGFEYRIIRPESVFSYGGRSYIEHTEDGPQGRFDYYIGADITRDDGEMTTMIHHKHFRSPWKAKEFVQKIIARGYIDPKYWTEAEHDDSTIEERFEALYQEEQYDRGCWG